MIRTLEEIFDMQASDTRSRTRLLMPVMVSAVAGLCLGITSSRGSAEQPPPPCHPNPQAASDMATVASRADVANLPTPLQERLVQLAGRPHTFLPQQALAEAAITVDPSRSR